MLCTWELLLDRMAQRVTERTAILRLSSRSPNCEGLAIDAITGDRPTRDANLKRLIAEAVQRLEQSKWADAEWTSELAQGYGFYGRYLRLAGAFAWLGIDYRSRKAGAREIHCGCSFPVGDDVDVSVTFEEVRSRLGDRVKDRTGMAQ